jgi:hypothetical protein
MEGNSSQAGLSWRTLTAVLALYIAAALIATWPVVQTLTTRLPGSRTDPLQALWVMRWYKDCFLHGHSVFLCPDIQCPVGAPLGNFSPLHFQSLLYFPLSLATVNDVLCYNLIWLFNLVFTGMGTFLLIWRVIGDRLGACYGGLAAMLSGPVLLHAHGHLELITLGWFPLFLMGWMRWVDEPSLRRLLVAFLLYLLVALSAAYLALFAVVPATAYVLWRGTQAGWQGSIRWLRPRLGWFAVFTIVTASGLAVLFACQIWSRAQGYALPRPKGEFNYYGAPFWSCLIPCSLNPLGRLLPGDLYDRAGCVAVECCSYVGMASIGLIGYAALRRIPFDRAGFVWAVLLVFLVLSLGAYGRIGSLRVSLPAEWLYKFFVPFRLIRVPARFNLCLAIVGAVPAAAALQQLLVTRCYSLRASVFGCLCLCTIADLAQVPFPTAEIPPLPQCYEILRRHNPQGTFLEVPQFGSGKCVDLNSTCAYWQSLHHGKTTAGYSGFDNLIYDNLFFHPSPFAWPRLADPGYLRSPQALAIDLVSNVRFQDYVWLYLTVHQLDSVIVHQRPDLLPASSANLELLKYHLQQACIFEDADTAVYDRRLLPPPQQAVLLCTSGWRHRYRWCGRSVGVLTKLGRVMVYNPEPNQPLVFTLEAIALHEPRTVQLRLGDGELASWNISPEGLRKYSSAAFCLPAGLVELTLESDGEDVPWRRDLTFEGDTRSYSLRVAGTKLSTVPSND